MSNSLPQTRMERVRNGGAGGAESGFLLVEGAFESERPGAGRLLLLERARADDLLLVSWDCSETPAKLDNSALVSPRTRHIMCCFPSRHI